MSAIRRVLNLTASDRAWLALTALLTFATLGTGIGLLATSSYLISRAALVDTTVTLALAITAVRFFAVGRAAFRYGERYVGHLTTFRVLTRIRVWCFDALRPGAPLNLQDHRRGDLVARLGPDVETMQDVALRVLVPPVASGLAILVAALVVGAYAPMVGVVLAAALLMCGLAVPLGVRMAGRRAAADVAAARGALYGAYVEAIDGLDELVVNARPDLVQVPVVDQRLTRAQQRLARVDAIGNGIAALAAGATVVTVLALAIPLVTQGMLDGVYLALIPLTALAAFEAIPPLAAAVTAYDRGRTAARRLDELATTPAVSGDRAGPMAVPADGIIAFRDVRFTYPGTEHPALTDCTLTVGVGETVAVMGPSGCGKSTLVTLLERFADPDAGAITIGGVSIADCAADDVRAHFGVVSQPDCLFDTTLRDNLRLAAAEADEARLLEALTAAALDGLPDGLDTRVGADGCNLSGGERQRVLIARALLADRPVLVLDEATSHLDRETEIRVFDGIRAWRGDQTMVVISHHGETVPHADRIVHLTPTR